MSQVLPRDVRNANIVEIRQSGEDDVEIKLSNKTYHTIDIEELIKDWLYQHKKIREVNDWLKRVKTEIEL